MNRTTAALIAAAVTSAVTAVALAQTGPAPKPSFASEKCYGIAKAGKNDCAAGANSCAGQATKDMDKAAYVYLPAGLCAKIAGASMKAM